MLLKGWAKWWENITNLNIREEDHIHESILFFVIVINYCLPYAKYYIYLEKLKDNNKNPRFNVGFLGYICYPKEILKIEQNICFKRNQIVKFDKFKVILENL